MQIVNPSNEIPIQKKDSVYVKQIDNAVRASVEY